MLSARGRPRRATVRGELEAPAEATRSRRWLRVPKAVLITVLGLALSAWLIPAMTRQWDDRQREHELKAGVVADMASSTAERWSAARRSGRGARRRERKRMGDVGAFDTRDRGAAPHLLPALRRGGVGGLRVGGRPLHLTGNVSASAALHDAVHSGVRLDPRVSDAAARLLVLR